MGTRFAKILVSPATIARVEVVIGAGGIGLIGEVVCKQISNACAVDVAGVFTDRIELAVITGNRRIINGTDGDLNRGAFAAAATAD